MGSLVRLFSGQGFPTRKRPVYCRSQAPVRIQSPVAGPDKGTRPRERNAPLQRSIHLAPLHWQSALTLTPMGFTAKT